MDRRVVITGIGMVTPLGNDAKTTWQNLIQGKSGIGQVTRFNPDEYRFPSHFSRIAGEVKDFSLEERGVDKKVVRRFDLFSQYAVAAALEALQISGLDLKKENLARIGVQIGCGVGGTGSWEEQHKILLERGPERVSPHFVPSLVINMAAGNLSILLGLRGPNLSSVSACASGAHAIGGAFDQIMLGRADIMVAGGTEAPITPLSFAGFDQMRALSRRNQEPEKASRPFDKGRDGFVLAEGAGIIILEDLWHALARRAKIYAEIAGFAANSDAHHITEPCAEGPQECMRLALQEADVEPDEVDYINAHGTSTPIGDVNETKAIKGLFNYHASQVLISSTKSMTGHLLGGAGGVETIFTVLALREGIIPPTINLENPDPECNLNYVPNVAQKRQIQVAISNSFGFGGTNACLVFRRFAQ